MILPCMNCFLLTGLDKDTYVQHTVSSIQQKGKRWELTIYFVSFSVYFIFIILMMQDYSDFLIWYESFCILPTVILRLFLCSRILRIRSCPENQKFGPGNPDKVPCHCKFEINILLTLVTHGLWLKAFLIIIERMVFFSMYMFSYNFLLQSSIYRKTVN